MFSGFKNSFSDGLSLTSNPMYANCPWQNIINVIVNYILIFGKFGFPAMGIIGAAIGTLVSRIIMFSFLFFLLFKKDIIKNYIKDTFRFIIDKSMIEKNSINWFSNFITNVI